MVCFWINFEGQLVEFSTIVCKINISTHFERLHHLRCNFAHCNWVHAIKKIYEVSVFERSKTQLSITWLRCDCIISNTGLNVCWASRIFCLYTRIQHRSWINDRQSKISFKHLLNNNLIQRSCWPTSMAKWFFLPSTRPYSAGRSRSSRPPPSSSWPSTDTSLPFIQPLTTKSSAKR